MNKHELVLLCWENLWRMKFRTILTIIGVVIGTASIIIMVSIGNGAQASITDSLSSGSAVTSITVYPNSDSMTGGVGATSAKKMNNKLTESVIEDIKKMDHVAAVTPVYNVSGLTAKVSRKSYGISGTGIDYSDLESLNYKTSSGRLPRQSEETAIVIGQNAFSSLTISNGGMNAEEENLEDADSLLGKTINFSLTRKTKDDVEETANYKFRVVGVLASTGGSEDYSILMNIKKALEMGEWAAGDVPINTKKDGYNTVSVIADDADNVTPLSNTLTEMGFQTFSMKQMLDSMDSVFKSLQMLLGGIGAVALLVACIGIVNTMTMSIYERTKEIGIMKVIGASVTDIRDMFVVESTMIGFLGGFTGILFSYLVAFIINTIAGLISSDSSKVCLITPGLVIFALFFSALVGMIAGVRPAIKAANLSSLDAIRTE